MLIVGDGPERAALIEDLTRRELLPAVCLTGAVAPSDVPALLASMDVGVAPYPKLPHFYFSPLKVYEYLAAGLPVIASGVGQLEEVIEHGVNGLLCAPGDPDELAGAFQCLREETWLRQRLSRAARATVLRQHTWEAVGRRILLLGGLTPLRAEAQELDN
jgi:glycosyltransferase involved in cell wall biosynthesis